MANVIMNYSGRDVYFQPEKRVGKNGDVWVIRLRSGNDVDALCLPDGNSIVVGEPDELREVEAELEKNGYAPGTRVYDGG